MKKQETGKKRILWIFLLIALVVVAAAAVLTVVLLGGGGGNQTTEPTADANRTDNTKLYWNVEKYIYSSNEQIRGQRDGFYYVRFAVDGEQVDIPVSDQLLVNYIDTMEVMGLVFDESGVVVDALRVDEMGVTIAAEDYYIESFTADTLVCNSMGNRNGLSKTLSLTEDTKIYMVDETGSILCGLPGTLKEQGKVLAVADESGKLTHVYVEDPFVIGDVYWNNTRMYDSSTKLSTRELDALGRFAYTFSLNGEQVTLYTRDQEVANAIDAVAAKCMGLTFDENGYITGVLSTKKVTGGSSFGSWYHVTDISGKIISAVKYSSENRNTIRGTMAADCKVYDVSGKGAYVGEPTELRLNDQIHGLKNEYGEICIIFVVSRTYTADIYYNVERQYDSDNKITKRTPAADGYYYIKLALNGKQVTLKTRDKDIVNSIDATAVRCFGLKVEGNEILEFYTASTVWGGKQFCSYDIVTSIGADGTVIAEEFDVKNKGEQTYTGIMAKDCGVYDVSSTADFVGIRTTLRVGDKIHALKDLKGNITYIFVVDRIINVPIYYNVSRQYDATRKTTKRTPNADGYYEIVLAINGEQKTYRTKDLEIVNQIDSSATRCFGLSTNGDVITKFYPTAKVKGGTQFCSYDYVTDISGKKVTAQEYDVAGKGAQDYVGYLTSSTKVYNVSDSSTFIGEKTTLQVGDKIHALMDADHNLTYVFVVERTVTIPIYWNVNRQYDSVNKITKRTPNAEGYYEIVLAVDGQQKTYKTKDVALMTKLDAVATKCFALDTDGDIITGFYATSQVSGGAQFCSWDIVSEINGNTLIAKEFDVANKGEKTYTGTLSSATKVYNVTGNGTFVGEETTLQVGDKIHALMFSKGKINIIYVVERTERAEEETAYCELCGENVTWYSWDGVCAMEDGKHYFLSRDINLSGTAYIGSTDETNVEVTLDLRGFDITASTRAFRIYGTFNLLDTADTDGTIYGNSAGQATGFYVYDAGTFNMYGGNFVGSETANSQCGIGALGLKEGSNAVFNMYGGSLKDGNTKKDGANLCLYRSSTFNMYGGSILGGKTQTSGGSISMSENAFINLYGGSIGMGEAQVNGNCIDGLGTITLHGTENRIHVAQIRLPSGNTLTVDGILANNSAISVLLADSVGVFTGETVETNQIFFADARGGMVVFADGKLSITREPTEPEIHSHCVCGGLEEIGDHTVCTDVQWTELSQAMFNSPDGITVQAGVVSGNITGYALAEGNYYLSESLDLSASIIIPADSSLTLCLNGNSIRCADRVFQLDGTLNLTDCAEDQGSIISSKVRQAPIFYIRDGGLFNMYGGILQGSTQAASDGGLGAIGLNADGGAKMNLYGGTITGGSTTKNGGNIVLYHDSVLNIYGGTITAGTATVNGGNLSLNAQSTVYLYGGKLTNGTAASGGNVLINGAQASFNLNGGEIIGGTINGAGANIRVSSGTLNVYSGTITGGTTIDGNGGSIFLTGENAKMNMFGGTVTGGTANGSGTTARHGGNIYIASKASLNITDDPNIEGVPTISNGQAMKDNGGNICFGGKSLIINGALITGGEANGYGDNVYISGSATLSGVVTINDENKENVTLASGATLKIDGLDATSRVGISMREKGTFASCADAATAAQLITCFIPDDAGTTVTQTETDLKLE